MKFLILTSIMLVLAVPGVASETNTLKMKARSAPAAIELTTSGATSQTVRYVPASALSATATNREPDQPPHPESPNNATAQRLDQLEQRMATLSLAREPVSASEYLDLVNEVKHLKVIIGNMAPPPLPEHRLGARLDPGQTFRFQCVHCGSNLTLEIKHP